jgi:hypothetical protein
MRTVRRRIHATLTTCRDIIEQLEQVEVDAFPTAFVTGSPTDGPYRAKLSTFGTIQTSPSYVGTWVSVSEATARLHGPAHFEYSIRDVWGKHVSAINSPQSEVALWKFMLLVMTRFSVHSTRRAMREEVAEETSARMLLSKFLLATQTR